jgi:asparagine synthase (glutamine-hydrolysing)
LARDRIGIKPLYYAPLPDGGLAFASELTALLEHPGVDRQLDPDGLTSLFFLDYIQPPHTIVRGARKLEPGHVLTWTVDGPSAPPRPFWKLALDDAAATDPRADPADPADPADLAGELRAELGDAVRSQLVSDVPLGVFLSGGIDSSIVAALAQRHSPEPLKTFSIAFDDPAFDESEFARVVAAHIGSRHFEKTLSEATLLKTLDRALDCLDEPIGDPSILPTFLLSQLAAEHVKVALGGDGADELWAGYPTYRAHRFAKLFARIPRTLRRRVVSPLVKRLSVRHRYQSLEWKLKRFVLRWDDRPAMRHLRWMSNTDVPDLISCLSDFSGWPEGLVRLTAGCLTAGCNGDVDLNRLLAIDLASYLPGAVLTKVDRASMAHGLEVRPPMLDDRLIDFAFSLPSRAKLQGAQTKAALKRAANELLPDRIIHRRKKGFAIPLAQWLQGPLRDRLQDVIDHGSVWRAGLLNRQTFRRWQTEHQSNAVDRSKPLWALMVLDHWYARCPGCEGLTHADRSSDSTAGKTTRTRGS